MQARHNGRQWLDAGSGAQSAAFTAVSESHTLYVCWLRAEDASVESAICQLLLGRRTEALSTLGVRSDSAADDGPDSGIRDFIRVSMLCLTHLANHTCA